MLAGVAEKLATGWTGMRPWATRVVSMTGNFRRERLVAAVCDKAGGISPRPLPVSGSGWVIRGDFLRTGVTPFKIQWDAPAP
jgi:hypothetical protein